MLTPSEVANKKFDKSMGVGYKPEQVDRYLEQIAQQMDTMARDKEVLEKKLEVLAEKLEEYRNDEDSLRAALLGAQKLGDSVVRDSKQKAELILRDANIKAEKILEGTNEKILKEQHSLERLRKEVGNFKNRLQSLYRQHLELISSMPDYEEKVPAVEQPAPRAVQQPVAEQQPVSQPVPETVLEVVTETAQQIDRMNEQAHTPVSVGLFDYEQDLVENASEPNEQQTEDESVDIDEINAKFESKYSNLRFGNSYSLDDTGSIPRQNNPKRKK